MTRGARYLFAGLAWAFAAGIVVQVFFIGLGLFAGSDNIELHVALGWILHLVPILILVVAAVARAGRRLLLLTAALAVTVFIVPILVLLRADLPARGRPAPGGRAARLRAGDPGRARRDAAAALRLRRGRRPDGEPFVGAGCRLLEADERRPPPPSANRRSSSRHVPAHDFSVFQTNWYSWVPGAQLEPPAPVRRRPSVRLGPPARPSRRRHPE